MKKVIGYLPTGGLETTEASDTVRFRGTIVCNSQSAGGFRYDIVLTINSEGGVPC